MSQKLLLIDFENVQPVDLSRLADDFRVMIFVGSTQKMVPIELVMSVQKFGERVEWQCVDGNGSNALDFYIACQLGRVLETSPGLECVILSKDKGFDPLLRHLNKNGLKCCRKESLYDVESNAGVTIATIKLATADAGEYADCLRVLEILSRLDIEARPRKRAGLSKHILTMFPPDRLPPDADRIIEILLVNKMIVESNKTIAYEF